jgi:hypothetical protein
MRPDFVLINAPDKSFIQLEKTMIDLNTDAGSDATPLPMPQEWLSWQRHDFLDLRDRPVHIFIDPDGPMAIFAQESVSTGLHVASCRAEIVEGTLAGRAVRINTWLVASSLSEETAQGMLSTIRTAFVEVDQRSRERDHKSKAAGSSRQEVQDPPRRFEAVTSALKTVAFVAVVAAIAAVAGGAAGLAHSAFTLFF